MHSILDQLSENKKTAASKIQQETLVDVNDKIKPFPWCLEYYIWYDVNDSIFEKRVVALFEPFGDVVIRDHIDDISLEDSDTKNNRAAVRKRWLLFNRPNHQRTDARLMLHLLIALNINSHPFTCTLYKAGMNFGLMIKYASIASINLNNLTSLFYCTGSPDFEWIQKTVYNFCDSLIMSTDKDKNLKIINEEIIRVRKHYLKVSVV